MASSSLTSKPFLGSASRTERLSGLCSDLRNLSSPSVQFVVRPRTAKKLQVQAAGSTFGNYFRVTTYGESHGGGVGCVIDGVPPRRPISEADLQADLDRRRPGQSRITTPRKETDTCKILSGVHEGLTTGAPIHVFVPNTDQRGRDYDEMSIAYRPSHADLTYDLKYGIRSVQGGGRSSARETIGRVAAGAVAKKILKDFSGTEVFAYVSQVHKVVLPEDLVDHYTLSLDQIESNMVRCPDPEYAEKMIAAIDAVRVRGESIGGVVTCIIRNCPRGLGSPVFDKLEAELAKACMSLPATKGFEFGSGFAGTFLTGSEHNDEFYVDEQGRVRTRTNRSGGTQGGISNGEIINMRIAFKPTATIAKKQNTVTRDKHETELIARGRHDPCVVPRAVPTSNGGGWSGTSARGSVNGSICTMPSFSLQSGCTRTSLQSDSKLLLDCIHLRTAIPWRIKALVQDINRLAAQFHSVVFRHIYREANFVADRLADLSHYALSLSVWFFCLPLFVSPAFHLDQLGRGVPRGFVL